LRLLPIVFVVALAAVTISLRYARGGTPQRATSPTPSSRLAQPYPLQSFVARDLNGRDIDSTSWTGRIVVVNFWATWCLPCRREIPELVALQSRHKGKVEVLGIIDDRASDESVREFISSLGINYPVVRSTFELAQRFPSVEAIPMTVVIDRQMRVVSVRAGEFSVAELEGEIRELLTQGD
jgi:thiol-disulfide isomerase/thioredoxin